MSDEKAANGGGGGGHSGCEGCSGGGGALGDRFVIDLAPAPRDALPLVPGEAMTKENLEATQVNEP